MPPRTPALVSCAVLGALVACDAPPPRAVPAEPPATADRAERTRPQSADTASSGARVAVWFSRGETPVSVPRAVSRATPEAALAALLAGPTETERAQGIHSWFSEETEDALGAVEERDGLLTVDFQGLRERIPGAGSSAGSAQLLASLDSTVFQFPGIDAVEYRLDGSCAAFWEWLQRECRVVGRR